MRPLFEECFHIYWTTTSANITDETQTTEEPKRMRVWLIVVIVIVVIGIILVIILCVCCCRRNREEVRYWKLKDWLIRLTHSLRRVVLFLRVGVYPKRVSAQMRNTQRLESSPVIRSQRNRRRLRHRRNQMLKLHRNSRKIL